jgi:HSP20 family protein
MLTALPAALAPLTPLAFFRIITMTWRHRKIWHFPLDSAKSANQIVGREGCCNEGRKSHPANIQREGATMIRAFADPFDVLFNLQKSLEARLASDWLQNQTASQGPFPPINVFQQGSDILAIIELPGVDKNSLEIQAKDNTIRISGKKSISYPDGVSVHRRERITGEFDRTLSLPVHLDADRIKAECHDGILALFLPRSERDKPRNIPIS